jgi:hypothetical protein
MSLSLVNYFHLHKANKFSQCDLEDSKLPELRILSVFYLYISYQVISLFLFKLL